MMKSRTVTEKAYYNVDFTPLGIFLEKTTKDDKVSPWFYLVPGQYIEGNSYFDWEILTETVNDTLPPPLPTGTIYDTFYQDAGIFSIPSLDSEKSKKHTCSEFKTYHGLVETYDYCTVCEKKK